jgi:hypothetical protein
MDQHYHPNSFLRFFNSNHFLTMFENKSQKIYIQKATTHSHHQHQMENVSFQFRIQLTADDESGDVRRWVEALEDEFEPVLGHDEHDHDFGNPIIPQKGETTSVATSQNKTTDSCSSHGAMLIIVAIRVLVHPPDDDDRTISIDLDSTELRNVDHASRSISLLRTEIPNEQSQVPSVSLVAAPNDTIIPSPEVEKAEIDSISPSLQVRMKKFFEGDDAWEDTDSLYAYDTIDEGMGPFFLLIHGGFALRRSHKFSYKENRWVGGPVASPKKERSDTERSRRGKKSECDINMDAAASGNGAVRPIPENESQMGWSNENAKQKRYNDGHRVIEWIRDCEEPALNLMDDALKIPGMPIS